MSTVSPQSGPRPSAQFPGPVVSQEYTPTRRPDTVATNEVDLGNNLHNELEPHAQATQAHMPIAVPHFSSARLFSSSYIFPLSFDSIKQAMIQQSIDAHCQSDSANLKNGSHHHLMSSHT